MTRSTLPLVFASFLLLASCGASDVLENRDTDSTPDTALPAARPAASAPDIDQPATASEPAIRRLQPTPTPLRGVNLAGADFGFETLPGEFGTHYTYPTHDEVDFFVGQGMNAFRLPFLWERLQPTANEDFNSDEISRIDDFVSYATNAQATVILDPHNYSRYYGAIIGTDELPVATYADLWSRLATRFKDNDRVVFGLMNEPYDMPTELWLSNANAALVAIRNTGAKNLVLVPGNAYTGAHSWDADWYGTPNSEVMQGVVDPGDNFAFEAHQYLDEDSSGTSPTCVDPTIGSRRLEAFTDWLRQHNARAFLGEFASSDNANCLLALDNLLGYMDDNNDAWIGWTYWAAGPWWGDDIFEVEPSASGVGDDAQLTVLQQHTPPGG